MSSSKFSEDFKRDAVAQITEMGIQLSKVPLKDDRISGIVARFSAMGRRAIIGLDGTSAAIGDLFGISAARVTRPLVRWLAVSGA